MLNVLSRAILPVVIEDTGNFIKFWRVLVTAADPLTTNFP
jgi:hypothetical protein